MNDVVIVRKVSVRLDLRYLEMMKNLIRFGLWCENSLLVMLIIVILRKMLLCWILDSWVVLFGVMLKSSLVNGLSMRF